MCTARKEELDNAVKAFSEYLKAQKTESIILTADEDGIMRLMVSDKFTVPEIISWAMAGAMIMKPVFAEAVLEAVNIYKTRPESTKNYRRLT